MKKPCLYCVAIACLLLLTNNTTHAYTIYAVEGGVSSNASIEAYNVSIEAYDVSTGNKIASFGGVRTTSVLVFGPDGLLYAIENATTSISIEVYDLSTGIKVNSFGSVGSSGGLAFGSNGFLYATGSGTVA